MKNGYNPFCYFWVLISLFLVLAVVFLNGKGSFLIAGYNTMSKEARGAYDEKALCHFLCDDACFSFCMALIFVGVYFDVVWLGFCGSLITVVGAMVLLFTQIQVRGSAKIFLQAYLLLLRIKNQKK